MKIMSAFVEKMPYIWGAKPCGLRPLNMNMRFQVPEKKRYSPIECYMWNFLGEKKEPLWLFRVYRGWKTTQLYMVIILNHDKDPEKDPY